MRFSQDFKLESFLFVAFFATLPLYSPNLVMFHDFGAAAEFMPSFVNAMMATSVVAGVTAAWFSMRCDGDLLLRLPAVGLGTVCYGGGFSLFVACLGVEGLGSTALSAVAGCCVAVGCAVLCIAWGSYLAALGLRQALFALALMVGVASLAELMLSAVQVEVGLVAFGLLLALGVVLPCWKAARGVLEHHPAASGSDEAGVVESVLYREALVPEGGSGALVDNVRRMASVLAMPFVGLLVFAFVMGVRKFVVFDLFYIEALGGIAAAAVVLPLCLLKLEKPLLSFIYQVFLPAFALMLVLLNSFPLGSWLQWLAALLSYVFFGVIGILALASLCAMAHAREFPPGLIYGLTVAIFMLVSFFGISCGALPWFADNAGPILLVICTAYFAFLVIAPLVAAWRRDEADQGVKAAKGTDGSNDLRERCDCVAVAHGLSPRETEILMYLGRGHGIAFVAKTLVISESTVRTHVKSVYKKLGVSSREELLQRVDEGARS